MQPWSVTVGYIYDRETTTLWLVTLSNSGRVSRQYVIPEGVLPPPRYLDRGMRAPVPLGMQTAASPAPQIEGIVIVNCTIGAAGHAGNCRIDKDLPSGVGGAALRLVEAALFQPARLFGIAVPVLFNVTVRSQNGKLILDRPAA